MRFQLSFAVAARHLVFAMVREVLAVVSLGIAMGDRVISTGAMNRHRRERVGLRNFHCRSGDRWNCDRCYHVLPHALRHYLSHRLPSGHDRVVTAGVPVMTGVPVMAGSLSTTSSITGHRYLAATRSGLADWRHPDHVVWKRCG